MNEYFPSLSVVAASTLPDGLIKTTVAFASGTLLESTMRPVILIVDRKREEAARKDSSEGGCAAGAGESVGGAGVDEASGLGVSLGVGSGLAVSVGLEEDSGFAVSVGVEDDAGFAVSVAVGGEVSVGVGCGVSADAGAAFATSVGVPLRRCSKPSREPFTFL